MKAFNGKMPPGGQGVPAPAPMPVFDPRMDRENAHLAGAATEKTLMALAQALGGAQVSDEDQRRMADAERAAAEAALRRRMVLSQSEDWAPVTKVEVG